MKDGFLFLMGNILININLIGKKIIGYSMANGWLPLETRNNLLERRS